MLNDISDLTRKIYESQHDLYTEDNKSFQRLYDMYENSALPIKKEWFKDKTALDGGCGNAGPFILWLFNKGIKNVYGIDVGSDWIAKLQSSFKKKGIDESKLKLKSGNILEIPYENNFFDFVTINGVLIHLNNVDEIKKAFKEGSRVLKPGGYYYTVYGSCGGAFTDAIFPALQKYYKENIFFKKLIDEISPEKIHDIIDYISEQHSLQTGENIDGESLKKLFGIDYCIFLQNYIKRPTDFSSHCTPEFVESLYNENGFHSIVRHNYYVKRTDIRKYVAPLHYNKEMLISKALYGRGGVQYLGIKK
tara:strand:+ start:951 stop:1868 length:918 start_codon:yes stop_codon:yes gene_type:complete